MSHHSDRRAFLTTLGSAFAAAACQSSNPGPAPSSGGPTSAAAHGSIAAPPGPPSNAAAATGIPTRPLGATGERVSLLGLGGFHIGSQEDERESLRLIRHAIDSGVTFMDNCWDYNEGQSEIRMGKALRDGYRDKVFLMTKVDGRTKQPAKKQLEQSLVRLQTDRIDLVQMHEIIRPDEPEQIFAPGGAMEALFEAKQAGKLRYIGFTGHKDPDIHLATVQAGLKRGFTFDAVQMPLNVLDAHYDSFEKKVLPVLMEHRIGVIGMKSLGGGHFLENDVVSAKDALSYAMSLPVAVVVSGMDSLQALNENIAVARGFQPLNGGAMAALRQRTKPHAGNGELEEYKTSQTFDGTARNPHWLTSARL